MKAIIITLIHLNDDGNDNDFHYGGYTTYLSAIHLNAMRLRLRIVICRSFLFHLFIWFFAFWWRGLFQASLFNLKWMATFHFHVMRLIYPRDISPMSSWYPSVRLMGKQRNYTNTFPGKFGGLSLEWIRLDYFYVCTLNETREVTT